MRVGVLLGVVTLVASLALGHAPAARAADCHEVKFIGVRGSGDPPPLGETLLEGVSTRLNKRLPAGTDYEAIGLDYTAVGINYWSLESLNITYQLSEHNGVKQLRNLIRSEFASGSCPDEKIVLAGFSQGSHVIADLLSYGATGDDGLSDSELAHIKAVLLFADPRFNSHEPFGDGSYVIGRNGILGARSPGDLVRVADRVRSWCRKNDIVCQGGPQWWLHDQDWYLENYGDAAASFAFSELGFPEPPASFYAGKLDVAFVIDTTGSMSSSITSVKDAANDFAAQLQTAGADFQLGLVEFRDGDQGDPFASRLDLAFTPSSDAFQGAVNMLSVGGGGDTAEYALSGINAAINQLSWRNGAKKSIILMTDAAYKDPEPVGGLTSAAVLQAARDLDPAQIYPVLVGGGDSGQFQLLADGSGGALYASADPSEAANGIAQALEASIVAPVAAISSSAPARPGEIVEFNAGGSYDPSGDDITSYDWDFDGDGDVDETTAARLTSHVYTDAFTGVAIVTVHSPAGTGSASTDIVIRVDAPQVPGPVESIEADAAPPGTLAFHWQPPSDDGGSPLTGYAVLITRAGAEEAVAAGIVANSPTSVTLSGLERGDYLVTIAATNDVGPGPAHAATLAVKDNAGNGSGATDLDPLEGDATPPTITPVVTGKTGRNGWYRGTVTITWTVTDPESTPTAAGCATRTVANNAKSVSLTCEATSTGGTASKTVTVKVDMTPPVVRCQKARFTYGQRGAIVRARVSDSISGVLNRFLSKKVNTKTGKRHVTFVGRDRAGNATTKVCYYTVRR